MATHSAILFGLQVYMRRSAIIAVSSYAIGRRSLWRRAAIRKTRHGQIAWPNCMVAHPALAPS
jgi:hypothetical protein